MRRTFRGWSLVGRSSVPSYRILGPSLFLSFVPKPLWSKQGPPAVCSYMTFCATTGPSDHRRKIPNLRVKANPSSLRLIGGYFVSEKNYNTYFFLINSSTNFGSYTKQQTVNFKISPEACLVHDLSSTIIFSQQCFYAFPTAEGKYAEMLMFKIGEGQETKAHTSIQETPAQFLNLKNECLWKVFK